MTKKVKWLLTLATSTVLLAGITGAVLLGGADDAEQVQANGAPTELWEQTDGFSLSANVDVPDYMQYGSFVHYWDKTFLYTVDENSQEDYMQEWEKNGMQMSSSVPGKKIYYKNVVDISSFTAKDDLLVFTPLASNRGAPDFTEIEFILEDADDPKNYLKITVKENSWYERNIMVAVSTPNVSARGYRYGDGGDISSNGCSDAVSVSFRGYTVEQGGHKEKEEYRHRAVKLHYDVAEKLVSVTGQGGKVFPVLDLDDGHSVGYGNEWKGFKNNRVKLSVSMNAFSASEARLLMLKTFGQTMNGEQINDVSAPALAFETGTEEIPCAEVGKAYPVYACVCNDAVSGELKAKIFLTAPNGAKQELTSDSFVPDQTGYYKLTYEAIDEAGNCRTKSFDILAQNASPNITIDVEQGQELFNTGEKIPVPDPVVTGGAGKLQYGVRAYRVGGEEVKMQDGFFLPAVAGEYHLVYEATDYLNNQTSKTLVYIVTDSPTPVWGASMQKLVRLFDGVTVQLPKPEVYDYNTVVGNRLQAEYKIFAKSTVGEYEEEIQNGIFTPSKEKFGESVSFVYKVFNRGQETTAEVFSYSVPVMDKPEQLDGYFAYDSAAVSAVLNAKNESDSLRFLSVDGVTGDQEIRFVNPVMAEGFDVSFAVPATATNFKTFTIRLTDSENADVGLDLQLRDMVSGRDKDLMTYVRCGNVDYAMNGTYNTLEDGKEVGSKTPMYLQYSDGKITDYNKDCVCEPTIGFNGEKFEGFPSGKVYVTFLLQGITGKAGFTLTKLSNQTFYAAYDRTTGDILPFTDTNRPQIRLEQDIADEFLIHQTVEIPYAQAFDALSPYMQVLVSLRKPNGEYVYKEAVSERGMRFILQSYGDYRLTYFAVDAAGRSQTVNYTISAKDLIAPTVVVLQNGEIERSVGDSLQIPDAIVQDNNDKYPRLFIMIVHPDYSIQMLGERTEENSAFSYTFKEKGRYYIRYYAVDASYNVTVIDQPVNVKESEK